MPKNSRPDIQVLEDRIFRLKNQLSEYKGLRLYGVTKKRLSVVSSGLEECLAIIREVVDEGVPDSGSSNSAFDAYSRGNEPEFSSDSDLTDTSILSSFNSLFSENDTRYSAAEIVKNYSQRLGECAITVGCSSGILQVNQFCQLLNNWYQNRFSSEYRRNDFYFKANRIHEWIDLFILAAGKALNNGTYSNFVCTTKAWIENINTPEGELWPLPKSVMWMKNADMSSFTGEAVLLEMIIKSEIYDESFYPDQKHSIKQLVMSKGDFSEEELTVSNIIQNSPKLIVTSSFDAQKYLNY